MRQGNIRELLKQQSPDTELWDHAYNLYPSFIVSQLLGPYTYRTGLSDAAGRMTGKDFSLEISNNSPKEYAQLFARKPTDPTLSQILAFDIIAFKNCFPASRIESDNQLTDNQLYYSMIFKSLSGYPNRFIVFTPPPLRKEMTTNAESVRARELANWLKLQENKIARHVSVFDFFDLLADTDGDNANRLKRAYCSILPFDSHPNLRANREIGLRLVECMVKHI